MLQDMSDLKVYFIVLKGQKTLLNIPLLQITLKSNQQPKILDIQLKQV